MVTVDLVAPFPWYGGKRQVADLVWRWVDPAVPNYVEPFAGGLAVLLGRPGGPGRVETVNDLDGYLCNFWRALAADPEAVAHHADWPVSEPDLHARHRWLTARRGAFTAALEDDPEYYDARVAGWWVWGIGLALCRWCPAERRPPRGIPDLGQTGQGIFGPRQRGTLVADLERLADRLRNVRVTCGDWRRVLAYSVLTRHGDTFVFLDPPYLMDTYAPVYGVDGCEDVALDVWQWAVEHGDDPGLRIVLCGYEGHYRFPAGWREVPWTTSGGRANKANRHGRGRENARRERLYFSPHCPGPEVQHGVQQSLFNGAAGTGD